MAAPTRRFLGLAKYVAVVTDRPLREVIKKFGHREATKSRDIVKILTSLGFRYLSPRLIRLKTKPHLAIAKLRWDQLPKGDFHWVVVHEDKTYDPAYGNCTGYVQWPSGCSISSYIPLDCPYCKK